MKLEELERHLWGAADILRGAIDADRFDTDSASATANTGTSRALVRR